MKDLYTVYMLCVECKRIYKLDFSSKYFLAIVLSGASYVSFVQTLYNDNYDLISKLIGSAIFLSIFTLGLIILSDIYKRERNCKVCNGKKTLIRLDTPKAIEIIKENNLFLPEEPVEPPKPKLPWQMD